MAELTSQIILRGRELEEYIRERDRMRRHGNTNLSSNDRRPFTKPSNLTAKEIWRKIKNDDPSLKNEMIKIKSYFTDNHFHNENAIEESDIAELGRDMVNSTQMEMLVISGDTEVFEDNNSTHIEDEGYGRPLRTVCGCISQNRSIRWITLEYECSPFLEYFFQSLTDFWIQNEKFNVLTCQKCRFQAESAQLLATSLLARGKPLGSLKLEDNTYAEGSVEKIIGSFIEHPGFTPRTIQFINDDRDQNQIWCSKVNELLRLPGCTLGHLEMPPCSERAIRLISQSLCDTSSINATFSSNHELSGLTLVDSAYRGVMPLFSYLPHCQTPNYLQHQLYLNINPDKMMVARQKIVLCHFNDHFRMDPFVGMSSELLLRVLDVIDKIVIPRYGYGMQVVVVDDSNRFSILFQLVRGDPDVCSKDARNDSNGGRSLFCLLM